MDNIGKMTEIEVKGNTIIQILSEVIQKSSSERKI